MIITFPNLTAKEIVEACDNKLGKGNLLWSIDWYKDQDFYTREKCRPRMVEVKPEIEHLGKTWDECASLTKEINGPEMMNFAESIYFIQEYFKATGEYPDDRWSWTSSRSSRGYLVNVGKCASDGLSVDLDHPAYSDSDLGVRFSRSLKPAGAEPVQGEADSGSLEKAIERVKREGYKIFKEI